MTEQRNPLPDHARPFVSRRIGDRVLLATIALPLAMFSFWGLLIQLMSGRVPNNLRQAIGQLAVGQLVSGVFTVSALALIWALFAPAWFEKTLHRHAARLLLITVVFVPLLFLVVWLL
jgi:hypothetical protein